MKKKEEVRRIQFFDVDDWEDVELEDIKQGMKIRAFEPSGEPVIFGTKGKEIIALSDAYISSVGSVNKKPLWCIQI